MVRTFPHLGRQWQVELSGTSHGVGSIFPPRITSWGVLFTDMTEPGNDPVFGSVSKGSLAELSDDALRESLEAALVHRALEDPKWDWRTVPGVAKSTGLSEPQVESALSSSAAIIRSSVPDEHGRALFTTRTHYKKRRSFLDVLRST